MTAVSCKLERNKDVLNWLQSAARVNSVSVGYRPCEAYPDGTPVAEVARTQEFGTPRIPPRPWIRPTIDSRKGHWARKIVEGLRIYKDENKLRSMWNNRGKAIVVNLQHAIDGVRSPVLSETTKARRAARGNMSDKPLVDTGLMRDALSYQAAGGEWQK